MSNGVRDPLSKRITSVKSRSFLCQMAVGRDGQDTNAYVQYERELKRHAISPEKWGLELLGWGGVRELGRYIPKFGDFFSPFLKQLEGKER